MNFYLLLVPYLPLGGGGIPLYKPYKYVPAQRVGSLGLLVWKRVYTLPIMVWNRVWFSREYGSVWTYLSFQFQMNKNEKDIS